MSTGTSIQWCDASWSPITGCTRVSAGCDNCYSARLTYRLEMMGQKKYTGLTVKNPKGDRHFNGVVKCHDDELSKPMSWKKPRRIFVSMSDTFHKDVPFEFIDKIFAVAALCSQHTFQILTKRPERMAEYFETRGKSSKYWEAGCPVGYALRWDHDGVSHPLCPFPLPNVWLGCSVEDQRRADERIPHLLKCPAAVRFLSFEPLLGPVDLFSQKPKAVPLWWSGQLNPISGIQWCIVGGESGPGARPCNIQWIRDIVQQCQAPGVACFVKQLGGCIQVKNDSSHEWPQGGDEWIYPYDTEKSYQGELLEMHLEDRKGGDMSEWPEDLRVREFPEGTRCLTDRQTKG